MAILGTKVFWKALAGDQDASKHQILKNSGYINIILHTVQYNAKANIWQRVFGGTNKVALSTNLVFKNGADTIEATTVQDSREVKANRIHSLPLGRLLALKVPAYSDGLELTARMTCVNNDNLENSLNLLNSKEFQGAFELAPPVVGQIAAITKLTKKVFTGVNASEQLEATYPGVIGSAKDDHPLEKNKLVEGYLIMIAANDESDQTLDNLDASTMSVLADGLRVDGNEIANTYIIYNVSVDSQRGADQNSRWYKKYSEALNKLEEVIVAPDKEAERKIWSDCLAVWFAGNALLESDPNYISSEIRDLKKASFKELADRFKEITGSNPKFDKQAIVGNLNLSVKPDMDTDELLAHIDEGVETYLADLSRAGLIPPM